jgi:hypothetical protein
MESTKTPPAQKRAVASYRRRQTERGLSRFEVRGLPKDKSLIREFAKRLALRDSESERLRTELGERIGGASGRKGGILAALRRSPLVGSGLTVKREKSRGRKIAL